MGLTRQIARLKNRKENKKRRRKVLLEPLEPRVLLSADLKFAMTGSADDVKLHLKEVDGVDTLQLIDMSDQSLLQSQTLADTSAVIIEGSAVRDTLTVDLSEPFSLPIFFTDDYSGDADTLKLVGPDRTWHVTGPDTGRTGDIEFSGIENLLGGPDNQDTFVFEQGGSLGGLIDGGAGGFDTLIIDGGPYDTVVFTPTGPDSGAVDLDGMLITYAGLEPITMSGTTSVVVDGSSSGDNLAVDLDGSNIRVRTTTGTAESVSFGVPTVSLTINGGDGNDSVTFEESLSMPGADLTVNAETITVNSGVTITADDITFNASATDAGLLGGWVNELYELTFADDVVLADSDAKIDLTGATLDGNNIALNATASLDLDTDGFSISSVTLAVIYAQSDAEVILNNTAITADGNLSISAASNVAAKAILASDPSSTDDSFDAALAISYIDSAARAYISGASQLTVGGDVSLSATNTVTSVAMADGSTTGTAGAALAMNIVLGTTQACFLETALPRR